MCRTIEEIIARKFALLCAKDVAPLFRGATSHKKLINNAIVDTEKYINNEVDKQQLQYAWYSLRAISGDYGGTPDPAWAVLETVINACSFTPPNMMISDARDWHESALSRFAFNSEKEEELKSFFSKQALEKAQAWEEEMIKGITS